MFARIKGTGKYRYLQLVENHREGKRTVQRVLYTLGRADELAEVEQAFRSLKSVDLKVRPFYHHLDGRVKEHVFLCMLAYYVEWHMRRALAPILFDDDDREATQAQRRSVVTPAVRSPGAQHKAQTKRTAQGQPVHSFQTLLLDLATIAKNTIVFKIDSVDSQEVPTIERVTTPTTLQQRAFQLLGVTLK